MWPSRVFQAGQNTHLKHVSHVVVVKRHKLVLGKGSGRGRGVSGPSDCAFTHASARSPLPAYLGALVVHAVFLQV